MKFELIHSDNLSIDDFENHSVWVEYYSAGEIEHIVNEGYTKEEVEIKLKAVDWSGDYWFKTQHSKNTTPYMFTRFKAEFQLPNKQNVKGYIEYTAYSGVQNYALLVNDDFIGLNVQEPDITDEQELELKKQLNLKELYPIKIVCSDEELSIENYNPYI